MERERAALLGGLGGPTAIVLALLFFGGGGSGAPRLSAPTPPQRNAPARAAIPLERATDFHEGQRLIEAYFDVTLSQLSARCDEWKGEGGIACPPSTGPNAFRVVVATVPDPHDSYLDWAYDADVEALRRAFASAGYIPHSYWMPEHDDSVKVGKTTVSRHDEHPGVLLFRRSTPDTVGLALLYLVPELPSSGVHSHALAAALAERRAILKTTALGVSCGEADELVLVGPTFSGSSQSLRVALDREVTGATGFPKVATIITGAATSVSNRAMLSDATLGEWMSLRRAADRDSVKHVRRPRLTFRAALNSDAALQGSLDTLYARLGVAPQQVVILSESGTEYGESFTGSAAGPSAAIPLVVRFPASVAALRGEFSAHVAERQRDASIIGLDAMARSQVSLADSVRPRERPPVVSQLTHSASDVALAALVRAISEHNIRLVVIQATDVRDKLWFADEIRRRVRDIVIVTFESNALMLRPEFAASFRGGIVVSSYPLLPEAQYWGKAAIDSAGRPIQLLGNLAGFTSDDAFGVFNAALESLGADPSKRVAFQLRGAVPNRTYNRPPVWTSVVGRGTLYPLKASIPDTTARKYFGALAQPEFSDLARPNAGRPHDHSYAVLFGGMRLLLLMPSILVAIIGILVLTRHPLLGVPQLLQHESMSYPRTSRQSVFMGLLLAVLAVAPLPFLATVGASPTLTMVELRGLDGASILMRAARTLALLTLGIGVTFVVLGLVGIWGEGVMLAVRTFVARVSRAWQRTKEALRSLFATFRSLRETAKAIWRVLRARIPRERILGYVAEQGAAIRDAVQPLLQPLLEPVLSESAAEGEHASRMRDYTDSRKLDQERESGFVTFVGSMLLCVTVAWFVYEIWRFAAGVDALGQKGGLTATMFVFRALHATSGVSPLVPLAIVSAGFALWLWWMLRQFQSMESGEVLEETLRELARESVQVPAKDGAPAGRDAWWRLANGLTSARRSLQWLVPHQVTFWATALVALVASVWGAQGWLRTIERVALGDDYQIAVAFERALGIGLVAVPAAVALAATRLVRTWRRLKGFLDEAAATALCEALKRLPTHLTAVTQLGIGGERRSPARIASLREDHWVRVDAALIQLAAYIAANEKADEKPVLEPNAKAAADALLLQHAKGLDTAQRVKANLTAIQRAWIELDKPVTEPQEKDVLTPLVKHALQRSEEFAALHIVHAVEPIMRQLHRLSIFLLLTLLACVFLTSTYPFQPESTFAVISVLLLLGTVGSIVIVMFDMNRDTLLSTMARTEPGDVTWDTTFIKNLVTLGVVPLLAFASSQFPALRITLFQWADPLMRLITKN